MEDLTCGYKPWANELDINVHEWPLPANELKAKSTIFELNLPQPFRWWRGMPIFFLAVVLKVGMPPSRSPEPCTPPDI